MPCGPMEKRLQGQARAGWIRWDMRMNMMENHKLESTLSPVSWAMGTEVDEKSQLRPGVVPNSPKSVMLRPKRSQLGLGKRF